MSQSFDADANSRLCHVFAQKCVGWYYRGEAAYLQAYEAMIDELVDLYNPRMVAINTGTISLPPNFVDALTPILVPYNKANRHLPFALFERCLQDQGLVYDPRASPPTIAPLPAPPASPTRPAARARAPASTLSAAPAPVALPTAGPSNARKPTQGKGARPNPIPKTKAGPASKTSAGKPAVVITRPAEASRKRKAPSDSEDAPAQRKSRGRKVSDHDNYQEDDEEEEDEEVDAALPVRSKRPRRVSSKPTVATEDDEAEEHPGLHLVHRPHQGVRKVGSGWYDNGLPDPPQKSRGQAGGQRAKNGPPAGANSVKKASAAPSNPPAEEDDDEVIVVDPPANTTRPAGKAKAENKGKGKGKEAPEAEEIAEEVKVEGSDNDDPAVYDHTLPPLEQARQLKRLLADNQAKNDQKSFTVFDTCQACEQKKKKCEFSLGPIRQSNNGHKAACNYCQKQRKKCEPSRGTFSLHTKLGDYKFPVEPPAGDDPTVPAPGVKGEDTDQQTVGDLLLTVLKETRLATERIAAMEQIMEDRYHPGTMEYHPPPFDIDSLTNTVQALVTALAQPPPVVPSSAMSDILARLASLEAGVGTHTPPLPPAVPAAPSLPLTAIVEEDERQTTPPAEPSNSPLPQNTPPPRGPTQPPPPSPIAQAMTTPRARRFTTPLSTVMGTARARRFVTPPPERPSVSPSPATLPEQETGLAEEDVEMDQEGQVSAHLDQDAPGDDDDETDARPATPSAGGRSPTPDLPAEGSLHDELNDGDGASETQGGDDDDDDLSSAPLTPLPSDHPVSPSKAQEEDGEDMDIGSTAEDDDPPPPSDPRNKLRSTKRAASIDVGGKAMGGIKRRSDDESGPSGGGKKAKGTKKIRT